MNPPGVITMRSYQSIPPRPNTLKNNKNVKAHRPSRLTTQKTHNDPQPAGAHVYSPSSTLDGKWRGGERGGDGSHPYTHRLQSAMQASKQNKAKQSKQSKPASKQASKASNPSKASKASHQASKASIKIPPNTSMEVSLPLPSPLPPPPSFPATRPSPNITSPTHSPIHLHPQSIPEEHSLPFPSHPPMKNGTL